MDSEDWGSPDLPFIEVEGDSDQSVVQELEASITEVLKVLVSGVETDPDFEENFVHFGAEVAVSNSLAMECLDVLSGEQADGHLSDLIREAFQLLSPEAQAEFCEKGF